MERPFLKPLLLCWFISCHGLLLAQPTAPELQFQRFGVEDGLSQVTVNAIIQDTQGYLWVGTNQGLNRYDGYEFRQYLADASQHTGPSHNFINALLEDHQGMLWVGTANGLNRYDPSQDEWTYFSPKEGDTTSLVHHDIYSLYEDQQQRLWIGTGVGFCRLDQTANSPEDWTFRQWIPRQGHHPYHLPSSTVHEFVEEEETLWLIATSKVEDGSPHGSGHLVQFDLATERIRSFGGTSTESEALPDVELRSIELDHRNRLWLGGTHKGLMRMLDEEIPDFATYPLHPDTGIPHGLVTELFEDAAHHFWAGTFEGLVCLPGGEGETFTPYTWFNEQGKPESFGAVDIIMQDRSGIYWSGSEIGLFKGLPIDQSFHVLSTQSPPGQQLIGDDIFGILAHSSGEIWVGSYQAGLNRLSPQVDGSFLVEQIPPGPEAGQIPLSSILNLAESPDGHIWVSSFEGVLEITPQSISNQPRAYRHFLHDPNDSHSLASNYVYQAIPDGDNIWLANYTGGLEQLSFQPNGEYQVRRITVQDRTDGYGMATNQFANLVLDPDHRLWVGSQGFQRMYGDIEGEWGFRSLLIEYQDRRNQFLPSFLSMYWETSNQVWLGSKNGLWEVRLLPGAEKAPWEGDSIPQLLETESHIYSTADGLPSQTVYEIVPDDRGDLWLSTQKGLSRFDPEKKQFRNYDARDGLAGDEFNGNSAAKDQRGYLYFGGINGLTYFHPDSLKGNQAPPTVVITEIRLFNEPLKVGKSIPQSDFQVRQTPEFVEELRLSHRDYVLSFEFAALDFTQPLKNQYAYQMEGLDEEWVMAGDRRFVTYTNLAPGSYTFRVKASNNDGVWNETGTSVQIVVTPPWWQRWWAWLIYAVLLGWGIFGLVRYRTRKVRQEMRLQAKLEQAKVEERERVRAQSSRDFHDEAGNHITKISLYTGLVKRGLSEQTDLLDYLSKIETNVKELSGGMKDFIWMLDPHKDGLAALVQRMVDTGYKVFEDSSIEFIPTVELDALPEQRMDVNSKRNLLLLFKEGMNNALKYARASTVYFTATLQDQVLIIELRDDGLGFERDKLARVNGLNNMEKRAEEIGASLEVEATPGIGTLIRLQQSIHPNG
ncbi:MAG: two-component regulator propeller domain-containing protein [Bacteroidota bacterium]